MFRPQLKAILGRDDVEVKTPIGFSISARGQAAAAHSLLQAAAERQEPLDEDLARSEIEAAARGAESLGRAPRVLWVDDQPSNNRHERSALHALGMQVTMSVSTEDALALLSTKAAFDVIISDMARPEGEMAGYSLLESLRRSGSTTPFLIYSSSGDPRHFDEAIRRGAQGSTNRPDELVEMVSSALMSRS